MQTPGDGSSDESLHRRIYDRLRSRYFFKVGAAILVLTVVLLGAGYFSFTQAQASVEGDAEETLLNAAEREADGIDKFVQDRNDNTVEISNSVNLANADKSQLRASLRTYREALPDSVHAIHYYSMENDEIVVSTQFNEEGDTVDEATRPWAVDIDAFDSSGDVRSFEPYDVDGEKRIGFISPVAGQDDHAIVLVINLGERSELLTSPIDGGEIEVVATDGQITLAETTGTILNESFLMGELPHLEEGALHPRVDQVTAENDVVGDDQVVVATVPLQEKDWAVTVIAPHNEVFDTASAVNRNILLLIGISIVGFVGVGAVISRDVNNSLEEMTGYAEAIEDGDLEVDIEQSRTDEFGQLAGLFARIRDTLQERLTEVEQQAQEAEQAREAAEESKAEAEQAKAEAQEAKAEAEALSQHLEEKADEYRESIEAAADGDLTRRLETASESQAMAEIGQAFNEMLTDIEAMVVRIQTVAAQVDEKSSEVTASTEEIRASSGEVAESIEEISAGAETQNEKLTTAAAEMSDLSATVEEIASSSNTVAEQADQAAERGEEGKTAASDAVEQMDQIESKAVDTAEEMATLQEEVERIGEVVELIDQIAEETNMLALNASIEAATAGEAGDGFAVVANEVKSLAEETAEATEEVEDLVETVEASTESVADDMFEMRDGIEDGRETIDRTVDTLESIVDSIDDANAGIQSINDATDDQADSAQEVSSMVDDIAAVSEQTADEAQNVSAAAEEQTSAISQISDSAESLSERAQELQSLTAHFETEADDDSTESADSETLVAVDD
ncbi:methyl-accepting chemotaxis protein [Halopiger aswanensis]|uniref:Methyl-accepting chemotaxis protein n=1 Tax=Halopiger aswanensis TaxID=148449 RepID=A0A419WDL5_9EURY|nr:HAMP domain-containing methyl-accepting chemotaxis protein [Halopiger aswanensis]RKD93492.1 methyl-accepting chemotaxis protein [Halopiger aswanensis]